MNLLNFAPRVSQNLRNVPNNFFCFTCNHELTYVVVVVVVAGDHYNYNYNSAASQCAEVTCSTRRQLIGCSRPLLAPNTCCLTCGRYASRSRLI